MPPQASPLPNPSLAASPVVFKAVRSYLALTSAERAAFRAVIGVWAREDCLPRGGKGTPERTGAGERRSSSRALLSPQGWVGRGPCSVERGKARLSPHNDGTGFRRFRGQFLHLHREGDYNICSQGEN